MSPQRGMAESMDYMPAYRMPARWPSMIGTLAASPNEPLRVQVSSTYHMTLFLVYNPQLLTSRLCVLLSNKLLRIVPALLLCCAGAGQPVQGNRGLQLLE